MKPEGGEREGPLWSEPERRGEPRLGRDTARRTRERGGDVSMNLYVHPSRGRRDRPARRTTDQSSEPASGLGPDALTSNWIAVKQLTGRVGGGTKDVGGVTVGGEGGLRGGGGTGSLRKERDGRAGSGQRTGDGGRTKSGEKVTRDCDHSQGFQSAERSRISARPASRGPLGPDASVDSNHLECRQRESGVHGIAEGLVGGTLTVKTDRAARREVSSAEARVTTEARFAETGATARARRASVLPAKAGRATTAEEAEVMAAIST